MGTVIEFPELKRETRSGLAPDELCELGEVLLFTGVRYSRLEPASVVRREIHHATAPCSEDHGCDR